MKTLEQLQLLKISEVAEITGLPSSSVHEMVRSGRLPAVDVSLGANRHPRWRIRKIDLDAFVEPSNLKAKG